MINVIILTLTHKSVMNNKELLNNYTRHIIQL